VSVLTREIERNVGTGYPTVESGTSGVSWAAVAAGAAATAAVSLILLALGAGAGLSSLSPFSTEGVSARTVGIGALLWLTVTEILSASLGGYLAGRLRTKWTDIHTHEVYFRDTAHGFLSWAVSLVFAAAFLSAAAGAMAGGARQQAGPGPAPVSPAEETRGYFVESLYRSEQPYSATRADAEREAASIFAHSLGERQLSAQDQRYLAQRVAAETGIDASQAERRVSDTFVRFQAQADAARKAVAHSLYWLFVALLAGAFGASWAATFGGRQRDRMHVAYGG
jgi:hypothetical protein